jgi:hypothetical protein
MTTHKLPDPLAREVYRQLLKGACGYGMWCPTCGGILDCRRAVLLEGDDGTATVCADCYDKAAPSLAADLHVLADGRDLFATPEPAPRTPPLTMPDGTPATQGRCRRCNLRFVWAKRLGGLKGTSCPTCHKPLRRTSRDAWCKTRFLAYRP